MSNVNARILLWGLAGSGKTTTLRTIHSKLRAELRGDLQEIPTRLDPTLSYETLPISLGDIGGVGTQLQLIAVPGAADQSMTRKQLLDEVDGIILVLDCSPENIEENFEPIAELRSSLESYGRTLDSIPIVLQYNKRDIADPFKIEEVHRRIGLDQAAVFETIATTGHGILSTLTTISKHVVRSLKGNAQASSEPTPEPLADADEIASADVAPEEVMAGELIPEDAPDDEMEYLEVEPTEDLESSHHDILEAAILAEGEEAGLEELADAVEVDLSSDEVPEWELSPDEASKPDMNLGGDLRIVSVGQATVEMDGGVRLPLVLGDESGQSRSVVLSLRLDTLVGDGSD
jgi:signal recognition particle receptor subunit beta